MSIDPLQILDDPRTLKVVGNTELTVDGRNLQFPCQYKEMTIQAKHPSEVALYLQLPA